MVTNVKSGPARALTDILGIDANGKGGIAGSRLGGSILLAAQFGITAVGITTQSLDSASWMTFAAPNTKTNLLKTFDHLGNITATWKQDSGRIDLYGNQSTSTSPVMVLNYNTASPTAGDLIGHYAFRTQGANGLQNTYAACAANIASPTTGALCSSINLQVMQSVDGTAGNAQPNAYFTVNGQTSTVTMPTGFTVNSSGNYASSATTGPVFNFTNTAQSRATVVGMLSNFNGGMNVTGGGNLDLQIAGTASVSVLAAGTVDIIAASKQRIEFSSAKTSNTTLVQADGGTCFSNNGAAGAVILDLPSTNPTVGTKFGFFVRTAQSLQVRAPAGVVINVGGTASSSGGTVTSSTVGNFFEVEYLGTGLYIAKAATGTGGSAGAGGWTVA